MKHPILFIAAIAALTACDSGVETRKDAAPAAETPAPARGPGLTAGRRLPIPEQLVAAGLATTIQSSTDDNIQWAASVVKLNELTKQGDYTIKLFGTAGGDPAMNGLQTYLAIFFSPAQGWAVFQVGDFLDYRVLSEAPGRVDIEVEESVMDEASGAISSRKRRLIVSWQEPDDGFAPRSITVTPAR